MKPALIKVNIAVFLWGFTGVLGRAISLNEGWLVWWRMLLTVISMWIFFSLLKKTRKINHKAISFYRWHWCITGIALAMLLWKHKIQQCIHFAYLPFFFCVCLGNIGADVFREKN
ncbi:MAG: hypothetical protein PW786_00465 [Arachidicoccus sp.]|nr:hypothetical protein [Arachidicoccus sp.]